MGCQIEGSVGGQIGVNLWAKITFSSNWAYSFHNGDVKYDLVISMHHFIFMMTSGCKRNLLFNLLFRYMGLAEVGLPLGVHLGFLVVSKMHFMPTGCIHFSILVQNMTQQCSFTIIHMWWTVVTKAFLFSTCMAGARVGAEVGLPQG